MVTKKEKSRNWRIAGIFLLLVLLLVGSQSFSIYNSDSGVWIPTYWTAECQERADSDETFTLGEVDNSGEFFECTTAGNGKSKYIPIYPGVECEYLIETTGFSYSAYECPLDVRNSDDVKDSCTKLAGIFSVGDKVDSYFVDSGKKIFINPVSTFGLGGVELGAKFPSYGLAIEQVDGFKGKTTANCFLNSVPSELHTLDVDDLLEVKPDNPFNAVGGAQLAKTTQLVELSDVNNGNPIYISRPGFYFKLSNADDGFEFVDTSFEYSSSKIECIPRTSGCSDDAKVIDLEDQSCDELGGAIVDYAPVQGNSDKLCKYSCSSGSLKLTNDCIVIPDECPEDKPLFDARSGECISVEPPVEDVPFDATLLIIGMAFVVILLVAVLIRVRQLNNEKPRGKK